MIELRPCSSRSRARSISDLGRPVDVRRGLVEDQDARVGEQRPGDRDELALARRQARSALAHGVVEPALQPGDEPVDADCRGGLAHLLVGRVGAGEAHVVGDRAREEERVLEHHAELAPVAAELAPRAGRCRRRAPLPPAGRRSGRSAWRASTCRPPTAPTRAMHPPAGTWMSMPWSTSVSPYEKRTSSRSMRPSIGPIGRAPDRSPISVSVSSTELILIIAAAADCTWPYTSESSCSGWNTSCSR